CGAMKDWNNSLISSIICLSIVGSQRAGSPMLPNMPAQGDKLLHCQFIRAGSSAEAGKPGRRFTSDLSYFKVRYKRYARLHCPTCPGNGYARCGQPRCIPRARSFCLRSSTVHRTNGGTRGRLCVVSARTNERSERRDFCRGTRRKRG